MNILLAIPCYNCEKQIPRVIEKMTDEVLHAVREIIIIDNQSTDGTVEAAKQAIKKRGSKKIRLLQNNQNVSLGGSHKVAFLRAIEKKDDAVAILHGDDQANSDELLVLIEQLKTHPEAAAILGARFLPNSRLHGYAKTRIFGNKVFNIVFSFITLRKTVDLGSGLNIFRIDYLADKRFLRFRDTLTFNVDLLLDYYRKKLPLEYVAITWSEDDQISNARNFKIARMIFAQLLRWRFGIRERDYKALQPQESNYASREIFHINI